MKRFGTVLVFRQGVLKKQALDALRRLNDVLEDPIEGHDEAEFKWIRTFDDRDGGPVWYVP